MIEKRERNQHDRHERRQRVLDALEVERGHGLKHRETDQHQHRRGRVARNGRHQRRDEEAGQKAQRGDHRGAAGPCRPSGCRRCSRRRRCPTSVPASPAPSVANESTISPRRRLIGRPSRSVNPAAVATPMKVESESKRSVKRIVIIAGSSAGLSAPSDVEPQERRREVGSADEAMRRARRNRAPTRARSPPRSTRGRRAGCVGASAATAIARPTSRNAAR